MWDYCKAIIGLATAPVAAAAAAAAAGAVAAAVANPIVALR